MSRKDRSNRRGYDLMDVAYGLKLKNEEVGPDISDYWQNGLVKLLIKAEKWYGEK